MTDLVQEPGDYWSVPLETLLARLESGPDGLSAEQACQRLKTCGTNSLQAEARATAMGLLANQLKSPILLTLILAAILLGVLQSRVEAGVILVMVLGSALLRFFQEYRAAEVQGQMRERLATKATVLRGGRPRAIPAKEVVPGDVVLLSAGNPVPADGVLLEAKDLFVSQGMLTGETFPVEKERGVARPAASLSERTNCVLMGTRVCSGAGRALVTRTGTATAIGQLASRLSRCPAESRFERGVQQLGSSLTQISFVLVLAVLAINVYLHRPVLDSLLLSLALAAGLASRWLPTMASTHLSRAAVDLAATGVIVRSLASIEDLGRMDVLYADESGTLTQGTVRLQGALDTSGQPSAEVFRYAFLNAHLQTGPANSVDEAIVAEATPEIEGVRKLDEVPYDRFRQRLSVVVLDGDDESALPLLITKGPVDQVLEVCTLVQDGGAPVLLDQAHRASIRLRYANWSGHGYRVLGVAVRSGDSADRPYTRADEHSLTFAGFLLFSDPADPGIVEAIAGLEELGVRLKLITAGNRLVAQHTARAAGLDVTGLLTGADLDDLGDEALWHAVEGANLFAEVDPNQRERIVFAAQRMGHVVGYLGDGLGDGGALGAADVGLCLDTAGDTAVATAVLAERGQGTAANPGRVLGVISQGIVQARKSLSNAPKHISITAGAGLGNMLSVAGASLFLPFLPMLAKQILVINLMTVLPELVLAGDAEEAEPARRPRPLNAGSIQRLPFLLGPLGSVFGLVTFGALLLLRAEPAQVQAAWFVESVLSAGLLALALRSDLPFLQRRPGRTRLGVAGTMALVALLIPYIPPLANLLGFKPLPPFYVLAITIVIILYFASAEVAKYLIIRANYAQPGPERLVKRREKWIRI